MLISEINGIKKIPKIIEIQPSKGESIQINE